MKKIAILLTATALACTVGATGVWAAGQGRGAAQRACGTAAYLFTDENGDGVCDYQAAGTCRNDTDGDGVCDYRGTGTCRNDADGDGICDYRGTGICRKEGDGCRGGQRACLG